MYFVFCPALCGGQLYTQLSDPVLRMQYVALFQAGWFLESMWTQVLILHLLRTRKIPFLQSKASKPVLIITTIGLLAFTAITFSPLGSVLGLTKLPLHYFGFLLLMVILYLLLISVKKRFYQKKYHQLI